MTDLNESPPDWGEYAAIQRAMHQILDDPKIFEDPLALRIIGADAKSKLRTNLAQSEKTRERGLRAFMAVRNRYAEDELARSISGGIRQYVILGAGLDTFAYRNPFSSLRVFEVDHPATQQWKRRQLENAAIPIPASVIFVPVDFGRQAAIDVLGQHGFKGDNPAFVAWLGVTRYLAREAVIGVLTSLRSSLRSESKLVVDFFPPSLKQRVHQKTRRALADWRFKCNGFRPSYLDSVSFIDDIKRIGFTDVQILGSREMNALYCGERRDQLRVPDQPCLVKIRV